MQNFQKKIVCSYNFSERCTGVALSENIMHLLETCNFRKKSHTTDASKHLSIWLISLKTYKTGMISTKNF